MSVYIEMMKNAELRE